MKGSESVNELQVFNNEAFGSVRAVEMNGEAWFVGKDVAEVLGYANTRDALAKHVDDEDKNTVAIHDGIQGNPNQTLINESGLYSLVLQSKLPKAKAFKHWVTSEVLPTIRKHGAYLTPAKVEEILLNPDTMIQLCKQLKEERAKRQAAENELQEARPARIFAAAVADSQKSILIRGLAGFLKQNGIDIGQNRLFAWMRENGFLVKGGSEKNMPTQRAMDLGLFRIKEGTYINGNGENVTTRTVKVTGKGQIYFVNKFLSKGKTA